MKIKYKTYWRKSGLKKNWGNIFLNIVNQHKPNNFLEVGVFCGVTARNVCELLEILHKDNFKYTGIEGEILGECDWERLITVVNLVINSLFQLTPIPHITHGA